MSRSKELVLLAQRIRALSQTGLVYSLSEYDTERYEELSRLSDEITVIDNKVSKYFQLYKDIKSHFRNITLPSL